MNMSGMELARIKRKVEIAEHQKEVDLFPKEAEEEDEEERCMVPTPASSSVKSADCSDS